MKAGVPVHKKKEATIVKTIRGKFTVWRVGMRVVAQYWPSIGWCIERPKWKGMLPLMNSCVAVPRTHLSFKKGTTR